MGRTAPTFEELREKYLRAVRNLDEDADITNDSDNYVRATATASGIQGLYVYADYIAKQFFPDTAEQEYLEILAAQRGIYLKDATKASGGVKATGTPGTLIPAGQTASHTSGFSVVVIAGGVIAEDGTASVQVQAANAGAMDNYTDAPVVFNSPPSGVNADALLTLRGGTDKETKAELLARLLYRMQHPPGGGNKYDYENWALEVPGVKTAKCIPGRRGLGTVDVLITAGLTLPSEEVVAAAQTHIDEQRPVTCKDMLVLAPVEVLVNTTSLVALKTGTLPELHSSALNAQQNVFSALAPGQALIIASLNAAMMALAQVEDNRVSEPAANVVPGDIGWVRLGDISLLPMPEEG